MYLYLSSLLLFLGLFRVTFCPGRPILVGDQVMLGLSLLVERVKVYLQWRRKMLVPPPCVPRKHFDSIVAVRVDETLFELHQPLGDGWW